MIFAAPALLLGLAALPVLWWLLRVVPPAPRVQAFPALRLLLGLSSPERTASRTPPWLLALRVLAAGLVVVGLAQPVLDAAPALPGSGPVLLAVDDGWGAAADWGMRMAAAGQQIDRADREGRTVLLLATAADAQGRAPAVAGPLPAAEARSRLGALRPKPWPPSRGVAATALAGVRAAQVSYVADGIAGPDDAAFGAALAAAGPVTETRAVAAAARLLLPPRAEPDQLLATAARVASPVAAPVAVLAQTADGRTLARVDGAFAAGAAQTELAIVLPPELRNRLARLVVEGAPSAGGVALLDERSRRRPVGLLAADPGADAPLLGPLFYVRRALAPFTELRDGTPEALLGRDLSVLVLADGTLDAADSARVLRWVERGGLLLRFAGPVLAEEGSEAAATPDPLLPVRLLAGDRQLGGAMSWSQPARIAPFAADSPFAGLTVPDDVQVRRQVLAEPSAELAMHTWARLVDGTPLVTAARRGAGQIVLVHVTANSDWSDLPLSGLFVDMLRRIVERAAGVAAPPDAGALAPALVLDGFGTLGPASAAARPWDPAATVPASPLAPPGLYGPEGAQLARNLGAAVPSPALQATVPGATLHALGEEARDKPLGPWCVGLALLLLAIDLLISLGLRGLLRPAAAALVLLMAMPTAHAETNPALATRLAYVVTGDATVDGVSRAGLAGLSDYVNRRTAAVLAEPAAVRPGQDELSFYPLLYWPVTADAVAEPAAVSALNDFMARGGVVLIDTRGGGSGEGFAPGAEAALRRVSAGLAVPVLAPLTAEHVLARSFYLLQDFPGRFTGDTVWVGRDQDRSNDSVSPVVIGANDWAAAWAVDAQGRTPYAAIPGGARQRTLAYRFGVNLVMYALTGNYKGDQVHVPAILERLGQ